ncbi:MAG: hypothetical protein ABI230_09665 [Aestuariivirga sp.]
MAVGIWREKDGWANEHSVRVKYPDGKEIDVPEHLYRSSGYKPPFEELPWEDGKKNA